MKILFRAIAAACLFFPLLLVELFREAVFHPDEPGAGIGREDDYS